ncbi:VirB4-like conjugal transfer ATPase, CD1110 family [Ructibacterium gallinarum]|uniref:TraE family protein n=1 Tax=Ructibacterium gallinarum TaxID=2779355 RepID=A0A9D5R906_9FIRM|nr:TraE family protein [Ructibacterium gallinarum]MBE5040555.1 TraE family protein [Ructibacterium gallinarum]
MLLFGKRNRIKKQKRKIPKTVQQSIPIDTLYRDGIFRTGRLFSKTWNFTDINYAVASDEDQLQMFLAHSAILNGLPTDAMAEITIYNRQLHNQYFEQMTTPSEDKNYLKYAHELNGILCDKMAESNNIVHEKYITVATDKKNVEEARTFFTRVGNDLTADFAKVSSKVTELGYKDRLRVFHDFFKTGENEEFNFDLKSAMARGIDFKDCICPDSLEFKKDHIRIGDKFARTIFLKEYPSFLKDSMVSELTDFSRSMMLSISIQPLPTDEAVKIVQKKLLAIETDITKWQQKQNMNNNFSANIPYEMEQLRKEIKEFLDDLTTRDQRMMFVTVSLLHIADTLEQLDNDTETLMSIGRKHLCTFGVLKYQQEDGMKTVLPYGLLEIKATRTLTTESTAVLSPYKTQEIIDKNGLYYGINAISHNLLMCNRKLLLNGNGFILGVSGSGKSFAAKMEILMAALFSNDDIIIVDAEREYRSLVGNLNGAIIKLSAASENHINALEINNDIDMDESPVSIKSEFLISLFDQLLKSGDARLGGGVGAKDKSIIDRCAIKVYSDFLNGKSDYMPTLADFRNELLQQPEDEAQDLALSLEMFTTGSLNAFAHQSDVNVNSRIVCYDILELGEQMKSIGLLIMLDNIFNRVMANRKRGKYTRVYVDEAHLYFKNPYSADFLLKCWKRFRKYGGLLTGITQNISDCLLNETARGMLANSEFLLLLNQSASDRKDLSELLSISDTQMSYITNAGAGRGLIKVGGSIVPFVNEFPTDTELYRLMSTKPGEN